MNAHRHWLKVLVQDFSYIHIGLGLLGNTVFVAGAVFFLSEGLPQEVGSWLFLTGSIGMLLGSIGSALVKFWERQPSERSTLAEAASRRW